MALHTHHECRPPRRARGSGRSKSHTWVRDDLEGSHDDKSAEPLRLAGLADSGSTILAG